LQRGKSPGSPGCREHGDGEDGVGPSYSSRAMWYDITLEAKSSPPTATAANTARVPAAW